MRPAGARSAAAAVALLAVVLLASPAAAGGPGGHGGGGGKTSTTGYDISYPQCGGSFPSSPAFGIVGVNDGVVYSANPCLATGDGPSELAWAQASGKVQFYANTADPGPQYSSYWPAAGTSAGSHTCSSSDLNSPDCSFVYGYNAALNSFGDAAAAAGTTAAAAATWWLDVETGNSWQTLESAYGNTASSQANDTAALSGAVAALQAQGVVTVGFYSTSTQWGEITGGTGTTFAANPDWVAGFSSARAAAKGCTTTGGFAGGKVTLTQYHSGGFDADTAC